MRGIAALQVVALHLSEYFNLPLFSIPFWGWYFIINGHASVFLFFIISGAAVSLSCERHPLEILHSCGRRVVRLGMPMVVSVFLGILFYLIWPPTEVGLRPGIDIPAPITAFETGRQMLGGMFIGYSGDSLLPEAPLVRWGIIMPSLASVNTPLWTLHVELIGSFLIVGLVAARALLPRPAYQALAWLSLVAFWPNPLWLFVAGHLACAFVTNPPRTQAANIVSFLLVISGIALCMYHPRIIAVTVKFITGQDDNDFWKKQYSIGEILIFFGFCFSHFLRRCLTGRVASFLGEMSFPIYLVHYPVIQAVTRHVLPALSSRMPHGLAIGVSLLLWLAITLPLVLAFRRWVDAPAIRLSRFVGNLFLRRLSPPGRDAAGT